MRTSQTFAAAPRHSKRRGRPKISRSALERQIADGAVDDSGESPARPTDIRAEQTAVAESAAFADQCSHAQDATMRLVYGNLLNRLPTTARFLRRGGQDRPIKRQRPNGTRGVDQPTRPH